MALNILHHLSRASITLVDLSGRHTIAHFLEMSTTPSSPFSPSYYPSERRPVGEPPKRIFPNVTVGHSNLRNYFFSQNPCSRHYYRNYRKKDGGVNGGRNSIFSLATNSYHNAFERRPAGEIVNSNKASTLEIAHF